MRITMLAIGSRGDVQPYLALALGLQRAGHQVTLATHENFADLVTERGIGFHPLGGNPMAILQQEEGQVMLESGRNPLAFMRSLRQAAAPYFEEVAQESLAASRHAEALIFSILAFPAPGIAEKLGIPGIAGWLQPAARTRHFPSPGFPHLPRLGGRYNLLTHQLTEQAFWQTMRGLVNRWRRHYLGLPPRSFWGDFGRFYAEERPVLLGYSRHVVPPPVDWTSALQVTGYWFLDSPEWKPPPALADFLAAGEPPVYIGFGSMTNRDPAAVTTVVAEALQLANRRGILLSGWGGLASLPLPPTIFPLAAAPHDRLFPLMAAVVHHGGAGTTAAGLRAGVPSVVVPFFGDQPFWAERVAALGVGPSPVPRRRLTAERLAAAIGQATSDEALRKKAAALGEAIRREDGVMTAVGAVEAIVSRYGETLPKG